MEISEDALELLITLTREPEFINESELRDELNLTKNALNDLLADLRIVGIRPRIIWKAKTKNGKIVERYRVIAIADTEKDWKRAKQLGDQYWKWKYANGPAITYEPPNKRRPKLRPAEKKAIEGEILKALKENSSVTDNHISYLIQKNLGIDIGKSNLANYRRRLGIPCANQRKETKWRYEDLDQLV